MHFLFNFLARQKYFFHRKSQSFRIFLKITITIFNFSFFNFLTVQCANPTAANLVLEFSIIIIFNIFHFFSPLFFAPQEKQIILYDCTQYNFLEVKDQEPRITCENSIFSQFGAPRSLQEGNYYSDGNYNFLIFEETFFRFLGVHTFLFGFVVFIFVEGISEVLQIFQEIQSSK